MSLLSAARGASFLLEMKNIAKYTTSALKILYLIFPIAFRSFCLIVTGTHAKFLVNVYSFKNPIALFAWLINFGTASIIPAILVLKRELPCRGISHMVWTFFRMIMGHFWLDIVTPYGLFYSLYFEVASIVLLVLSPKSPLNNNDDWEFFDEKILMYGNVTVAICCMLVNIIVIIMSIYRVGNIGKCVRNVWIDLNIYKKDSLVFAKIENGKPKKKPKKYLYNI
ncbi:unnamed protein product, partial [Meganyctiphanes norvegica]